MIKKYLKFLISIISVLSLVSCNEITVQSEIKNNSKSKIKEDIVLYCVDYDSENGMFVINNGSRNPIEVKCDLNSSSNNHVYLDDTSKTMITYYKSDLGLISLKDRNNIKSEVYNFGYGRDIYANKKYLVSLDDFDAYIFDLATKKRERVFDSDGYRVFYFYDEINEKIFASFGENDTYSIYMYDIKTKKTENVYNIIEEYKKQCKLVYKYPYIYVVENPTGVVGEYVYNTSSTIFRFDIINKTKIIIDKVDFDSYLVDDKMRSEFHIFDGNMGDNEVLNGKNDCICYWAGNSESEKSYYNYYYYNGESVIPISSQGLFGPWYLYNNELIKIDKLSDDKKTLATIKEADSNYIINVIDFNTSEIIKTIECKSKPEICYLDANNILYLEGNGDLIMNEEIIDYHILGNSGYRSQQVVVSQNAQKIAYVNDNGLNIYENGSSERITDNYERGFTFTNNNNFAYIDKDKNLYIYKDGQSTLIDQNVKYLQDYKILN